jgi:hypothetical protein
VPLSRKMLFHQGSSSVPVKTSAEDTRLSLAALWTPDPSNAVKVRQGVVNGPGATSAFAPCQVVAGSGQVTVKPGRVVIQGSATSQGAYVGTIDTDTVRTVAAAAVGAGLPSAGQFKAGRVIVRVYDQLYDGGSRDDWDVEIHCGSAAATPGAAALPAVVNNSLQLRTFTVDSAGAVTLAGAADYTTPRGGIPVVPQADNFPGAYDGQYRDVIGLGLQRWSASGFWDGVSQWQQPLLRLRANHGQFIPNAAWSSLSWNIEDYDTHGMYDVASNDKIVVCRRAGYYQVSAGWSIQGAVHGRRIISIWKNGAAEGIARTNWAPNPGGDDVGVECAGLVSMNVGDWLEVAAWQNAVEGVVQVASAAHAQPVFNVHFVRAW